MTISGKRHFLQIERMLFVDHKKFLVLKLEGTLDTVWPTFFMNAGDFPKS